MTSCQRNPRRSRPTGLALVACLLIAAAFSAAPASAAPGWLKPADLSKPGRDASNPVIAMDNAGNSIAMWERENISDPSINLQISTRAPGGSFTEPVDFMLKPTEPDLAMTPGGEAVAVWKRLSLSSGVYVIESATRPIGASSFSAPVTVYTAPPKVIPQELELAVAEGGNAVVTWARIDPDSGLDKVVCGIDMFGHPFKCPNPTFVEASVRRAGGAFSEPVKISPPRGIPPEGENEEEKEEREIEESKRSAGQGRPTIDTAGNATVVWSYFDNTDQIVQWAARDGETFTPPAQLSASGADAAEPEIGTDSAGTSIAVWARAESGGRVIQAAQRPTLGVFAPLGNVSDASGTALSPSVAVNSGGTAIVVWRLATFSASFIQESARPPGGSFSVPAYLSNGKDNPLFPEVAMNDSGAALVAWSGSNGPEQIARAVSRPPGGGFGAPEAISQSSPGLFHTHLAIDAAGDGTAVWVRSNGTHEIVQMAGFDGSPPTLSNVSIPPLGKVGQTLQFSATDGDAWPIGPPHFGFGDGAGGDGTTLSHAYSKPGTYEVTVTATDGAGTTVTASGTTLIKARNEFTIGKLSRNRRTGTATLLVTVPEPGTLVVTGKGVKKATLRTTRGATLKVPIKPNAKGRKGLNKKGKLKSKLRLAYSPVGGDTNTLRDPVSLRKILG